MHSMLATKQNESLHANDVKSLLLRGQVLYVLATLTAYVCITDVSIVKYSERQIALVVYLIALHGDDESKRWCNPTNLR
jgi:hypothetical protein